MNIKKGKIRILKKYVITKKIKLTNWKTQYLNFLIT